MLLVSFPWNEEVTSSVAIVFFTLGPHCPNAFAFLHVERRVHLGCDHVFPRLPYGIQMLLLSFALNEGSHRVRSLFFLDGRMDFKSLHA